MYGSGTVSTGLKENLSVPRKGSECLLRGRHLSEPSFRKWSRVETWAQCCSCNDRTWIPPGGTQAPPSPFPLGSLFKTEGWKRSNLWLLELLFVLGRNMQHMTDQARQVVGPSCMSFGGQTSTSAGMLFLGHSCWQIFQGSSDLCKASNPPTSHGGLQKHCLPFIDSVFKRKKISQTLSNEHVLLPAVCAGVSPPVVSFPWDLEAGRKADCSLMIKYTQQAPFPLMTS